jgi:RNA polymerase sigma-70 factor (family 1)
LLQSCYIAKPFLFSYLIDNLLKIDKTDTLSLWKRVCFEDDLKAFELLFHMLNTRLIKFCIFYIRQKEAAEDIVSEIFVKCWENRKNLADISNPETYLFVAVKNQSFNYLKKFSNIHLVQIESSDEVEFVNTFDPEKELERKELHFLLDQAIAALPQQACIIFKLIKEDGMKYKEVAEILNISSRTVQTQLFRAMKKLSIILAVHRVATKSIASSQASSPLIGLTLVYLLFKIFFVSL